MWYNQYLRCPSCKGMLFLNKDNYYCDGCQKTYSSNKGIYCFIDDDKIHPFDRITQSFYYNFNTKLNSGKYKRFVLSINQGLYSVDDQWNYSVSRASTALYQRILSNIVISDKRILDIGCGRGGFLRYIKNNSSPQYLIGTDICLEGMRYVSSIMPEIAWIQADYHALPFDEKIFDIVFAIEAGVFNNPYEASVINEISRLLDHKGLLVLSDVISTGAYDAFINHINDEYAIIYNEDITKQIVYTIEIADNSWGQLMSEGYFSSRNAGKNSDNYYNLKKGCTQYHIILLQKR